MSKRSKKEKIDSVIVTDAVTTNPNRRNRRFWIGGATALLLMIGIGVFAKNGWFPAGTDGMTGEKTGWFGSKLPKNAGSSWNPFAAPLPTATPQLSKEYIHAGGGGRLLAVVDANANEAPPADLAVWRPSSGYWYILGGPGSAQTFQLYGQTGDVPLQGDFDGDGKTDFAIARPTSGSYVWYVLYSGGGSTQFTFGLTSDTIAVGDYDGDGKSDVAVYRSTTGVWYILRSSDLSVMSFTFGISGDLPASADYDGDGKADIAVLRSSNNTFYSLNSSDSAVQTIGMSVPGMAVSADYDGDGKANYAVRNGVGWVILNSARTAITTTTPSGDIATDIPVQNDYDGDGKVDIAVWRPIDSPSGTLGHWFIRKSGSSNALREEAWGTTGDKPVAAYWRR